MVGNKMRPQHKSELQVLKNAAIDGMVSYMKYGGAESESDPDYDPNLHHLYLAGQYDATLAIVGVTSKGEMAVLGTTGTAVGAHCVVSDGHGHLFVCDPDAGALLVRDDHYGAIRR